MSSTYSSSLRIELIGSGDQAGAWGATTDSNLAYILDTAIAGYQAVPITSTAQALTYVNGPSSTANLNQAVYAMLKFTGASAATSVYIPPASKQYIVWNNTSYAITIYNSTVIGNTTAAGTGITLSAADKIMVWSDGTNVYDVKAQNLTGTLAIVNGGTGQTTQQAAINALTGAQTNNRVLRSDGTNATLSQVVLTTDVTGTLPIANGGTGVTTLAALGSLFYPVGSIYSSTVATNPGTSLGFGTWTAFGAGRVMVGNGGGFSAGATGGSADAITVSHTHTATVTDPGHTHANDQGGSSVAGPYGAYGGSNSAEEGAGQPNNYLNSMQTATTGVTVGISTTGLSGTNANLQPYIVVYMWERTA
jgi:hypothetical protein